MAKSDKLHNRVHKYKIGHRELANKSQKAILGDWTGCHTGNRRMGRIGCTGQCCPFCNFSVFCATSCLVTQYISHSIRNSQSPIRPVSVPGSPSKATTHLASATPRDPENEKTATAAARNSHISVISQSLSLVAVACCLLSCCYSSMLTGSAK